MSPDLFLTSDEWPYTKAKTSVLLAAASVIRELGPRSATLKNIAHRAGITEPAIFRHFNGVDGLFAGLFSVCELFYKKTAQIYAEAKPGLDGYLASTRGALGLMASFGDFSYLIVNSNQVFSGYEELKARTKELRAHDRSFGIGGLDQLLERGEIKAEVPLETVGLALMGMLHMTMVAWLESEPQFDLVEVGLARISSFLPLVRA